MIKFKSLKGENICRTRKKLNLIGARDESVNPAFARSRVVKESIRKFKYFPQELASISDVKEFIDKEIHSLPYVNNESCRLQVLESQAISERYLNADARICRKPIGKKLKFAGEIIDVQPDFVYEYLDAASNLTTIEVVVLSAGRTEMGNTSRYKVNRDNDVFQSLISLSLLLYGIDTLGNRKGIVKVTYDSLKTSEDKNGDFSAPWKVAKPFKSTKKDNSVSFSLMFKNKKLIPEHNTRQNIFIDFKNYFAEFIEGTDCCSKSLCDSCSYNPLCNYVHPPVKEDTKIVSKSVNGFTISPEQEKIINFDRGICRVNAGAGAGKTFVIVQNIIHLLEKGVKPSDILVTTFTNAGISELKDRIEKFIHIYELPVNPNDINISSFNSLGGKMIEKHYLSLGFTKVPYLIDDIEAYNLIVSLIKDKKPVDGLDYKNIFMHLNSNVVGAVPYLFTQFTLIREQSCQDVHEYMDASCITDYPFASQIFSLYLEFESLMKENNYIDYSDQSNLVLKLLSQDDSVITDMFPYSHIIVDEFQDSNDFQIMFISELISSLTFKSLMVVGDDSQSIFGFRGSSPENIINFREKIGADIYDFNLTESFRSTKNIINAANEVISLNKNRIAKEMTSSRENGKPVKLCAFSKSNNELAYIANEIEKLINNGASLDDICFISHKNSTLNSLNKLLAEKGILGLAGRVPYLADSRIIAAISLAEFIFNSNNTKSLLIYLNDLFDNKLHSMDVSRISSILDSNVEDFNRFFMPLNDEEKKAYLLNCLKVLDDGSDSVYSSFLSRVISKSSCSFTELVDYILKFKIYNSTASDTRKEKYEAVTLTTVHSSKGLEWKYVFLSLSDFDSSCLSLTCEEMEEKRRLIFVGITRARDELTMTSVKGYNTAAGYFHRNRFFLELSLLSCFDYSEKED